MQKAASALTLLALSSIVCAADQESTQQDDPPMTIWVNAGMLSRHFDRSKNYRENNNGFGIELGLSDINTIYAGEFKNSDNASSRDFGWMWKPLALGPARAGLVLGAFDGYARVNNGNWFPAVFPVASIEYRYFGVNLTVIPTVGDKLHGAMVAQIKLRLY